METAETTQQALAAQPPTELAEPHSTDAAIDPMRVLLEAVRRDGIDIAVIERIESMAERYEDRRAEREFNIAFAQFKSACPPIERHTDDDNPSMMVTRNGVKRPRRYASLDDIDRTVRPVLARHGLSYGWTQPQVTGDVFITISSIIRHEGGHSIETPSPPIPVEGTPAYGDRKGSSASPAQRYGIASTYAMRYSLIAALGLTTCDPDDDGRRISADPEEPKIDERQLANLVDAIDQTATDRAKFMRYFKITALSDLPVSQYDRAMRALAQKEAKR